ncbi:MAG TPA: hypothetical protein VMU61_17495 [Candidatus Aquilonibacter sp.]|nr:hypothetical protein [Candidatus Aquilonibacter sp.]
MRTALTRSHARAPVFGFFALIAALLLAPHPLRFDGIAEAKDGLRVSSLTYHGWAGSLVLSNGTAEVVVVPAIGRVMQFHFVGEADVFWEGRTLDGKPADPSSKEWINFGGDKTWPQPQSDWEKLGGRGWPPPSTFDSVPLQATIHAHEIEIVSPVDAVYGIRTRRRIELDPARPVLTITTTYEKVSGAPLKVGIAVITQLRHPQRAFMLLPEKSRFPDGYVQLAFGPPQDVKRDGRLLSLARGTKESCQIGSDAGTLLWMNDKYVLRIDSPRVDGGEYPDRGSSGVIYTNPDPAAYVELEMYGPLRTMKAGDRIERTSTYTLLRRTEKNPEAEARRILQTD